MNINAKQNAKLNSFRAAEKHIEDNAVIISSTPAFQTAFTKLKAKIAAIVDTAQQKSGALSGAAGDKKTAKQTLCKIAATVAGAIYAYASANRNETLQQSMNLPVTTLMRMRDEAVAPLCQMIHDRAETDLEALRDYGIKPAHLTDLQTAIADYFAKSINPRSAITNRKTVNANLTNLFREADEILKNQLDKLIELFREDHPDFVNTYFETRIIVDPPTRPRKFKTDDAGSSLEEK